MYYLKSTNNFYYFDPHSSVYVLMFFSHSKTFSNLGLYQAYKITQETKAYMEEKTHFPEALSSVTKACGFSDIFHIFEDLISF